MPDELTGLATLAEMQRGLDREFDRRRRFGTPIGLVLLEINDFKKVIERYGNPRATRC